MSIPIRPPIIKLNPGQQVSYSGYPGAVIRHYDGNMYEIRLASGCACVDAGDLITTDSLDTKLETFRATVEAQYRAAYMASYPAMPDEITARDTRCKLTLGSKWARVDVGSSGKYMIDMATGEIVGIKAYGVPHKGHRYGTLDTIEQFDWSGYTARRMAVTA